MKAYVDPSAEVHPSAILRPGCWIGPKVRIGPNAIIGHYSVIGGMPEHAAFYDDVDGNATKGVVIGEGARIFEFVTIQAGTTRPTAVQNNGAVLQHSHVAHDCIVGDHATLAGRASLAGFVIVGYRANVAAHVIVHQHCVIGAFAMVGMASVLKAHVPPGQTWMGYPARQVGVNKVGLDIAGLTMEQCLEQYGSWYDVCVGKSRL